MIRKICGMKCGCERYECGYDEAGCPKVRDLETAPTVSADEVRGVVRCSECKYAMHRTPVGIKTEILCDLFYSGMKKDDYCSYGKMMEVTSDE